MELPPHKEELCFGTTCLELSSEVPAESPKPRQLKWPNTTPLLHQPLFSPNPHQRKPNMHPSPSPSPQTNSREDDRPVKRRKVRKGTQSCWECKKRKVRCIWASPTTSTCNNCVRRKSKCVSQEFTDELNRDRRGDDGLETRLSRVENLLERLVESTTDRQHDIAAECMRAIISERSGSTIVRTSSRGLPLTHF